MTRYFSESKALAPLMRRGGIVIADEMKRKEIYHPEDREVEGHALLTLLSSRRKSDVRLLG